jgi:hypothetical protein
MKKIAFKFKTLLLAFVLSFTALTTTSCDALLQILEEMAQPVENTEKTTKEETKQPSGKTMKKFPAPEE